MKSRKEKRVKTSLLEIFFASGFCLALLYWNASSLKAETIKTWNIKDIVFLAQKNFCVICYKSHFNFHVRNVVWLEAEKASVESIKGTTGDILKVLSRENTRKSLPSNLICMYFDAVREDLIRVLEENSRKVLFVYWCWKFAIQTSSGEYLPSGYAMLMLVMASFKLHFVSFFRCSYACGIITRTKRDSRKTFKRLEFLREFIFILKRRILEFR